MNATAVAVAVAAITIIGNKGFPRFGPIGEID